jgi:predicted  nucleic acid-binding Zn-ribbon protein
VNSLLKLQQLDARIYACHAREKEIPKQKTKFLTVRERLSAELKEREHKVKALEVEQRSCETDIEQKKAAILKYQQQLNAVKKNDEYTALLHEIDTVKKGIGQKEERIITIMVELDEAKARLGEDRKRIAEEQKVLDKQCAEIDAELAEAVKQRLALEAERPSIAKHVSGDLLPKYDRLRKKYASGDVVVPMANEVCSGCNMLMRPQVVNEILQGHKIHACQHCGRLLYHPDNHTAEAADQHEAASGIEA